MMMTIKDEEAGTILHLMGVADMERGLTPNERALRRRILRLMTAVALEYRESAFEREAWSVAAELSPDVKLAREEFAGVTHPYDKHVVLLRTIDETKSSSYDRIMASVLEGWVF
jgi:predicted lipid-binding transport protein (Tim44 family)